MKSCLLCKFEFVQCSACFFDQATGLVFLLLSNQRLLERFYSIYRDRHFICSGYMCSLPSYPCHSSCISSCCDVLKFVPCSAWFFDQARGLVLYSFSNQRLLEGFLYGTLKTGMLYISDICEISGYAMFISTLFLVMMRSLVT